VALDHLHHSGFLRISGREKGRRIYIINSDIEQKNTTEKRLQKLVMAIVHILYPVTEQTLHEALIHTRKYIGNTKPVIERLVKSGNLERQTIDKLTYLWPIDTVEKSTLSKNHEVKILAPFDPLVWDRRRFEHLWGWRYRFEAYTRPDKRLRGYYAMPILWRDQIIGWSNIAVRKGNLVMGNGYIDGKPQDPRYESELKKELLNIENFLGDKTLSRQ
jgi:uncharacterized protein YcaQ